MFKTATLLFGLFAALLSFSSHAQHSELNLSFEQWETRDSVEQPVGWASTAVIPTEDGIPNVSKYDQIVEGSYALQITSAMMQLGEIIPGIAFNGEWLHTARGTMAKPGKPFTSRPEGIGGSYTLIPVGTGDTCTLLATLSRFDTILGRRVEIGRAMFSTSQMQLDFKAFYAPFEYSSNEQPDTLSIIISTLTNSPKYGTELVVDNLNFEDFTSVAGKERSLASIDIFPNPTSDRVTVDVSGLPREPYTMLLYNTKGQIAGKYAVDQPVCTFGMERVPTGPYFYHIVNERMEQVSSGKLSVKH